MNFEEIKKCLDAVGFIGAWHVDFTTHKYRATDSCGDFFGIKGSRVIEGVNLDLLDPAYLPEDLEMVKRHRRSLDGSDGRHKLHYKLRDVESGMYIPIQSLMNVSTDRFGLRREARGILLRASEGQFFEHANDDVSYKRTLLLLVDAANAVKTLGYPHLHVILQTIFKQVARDAIARINGSSPH